jgi:hypothetical protein
MRNYCNKSVVSVFVGFDLYVVNIQKCIAVIGGCSKVHKLKLFFI